MKIKDLILGLVVSVALFPACQPEEVLGPASLKSTQENVEVDMNGGEATFVIKATRDWTATVSPEDSGFEVFPLSGKGTNDPQTITVKAEANKGRVRSASITFTADGTNPLKVTVVQNGELGEIYPISEIMAYEEGAPLPVAKMKVLLLSDFSLGNVAQKNLYVQDATGGLQIRLSAAHEFNQGDSLLIDLDGAVISQFNGLKQVSINNSKISRFDEGKPLKAKEVSVAGFMSGAYEGQYISLNDVQVVEEELTYKLVAFDESTNVMVESKRTEDMPGGKRFYIYSYHDSSIKNKTLAETQVPQGAGTIKGIASVSGDKMQLVLTSLADIEGMTGERFEPASFVNTDANNYRVNGDAGSVKIAVESNTSWTLEKAVDADWLTLSQTSGTGNAEVIVTYQAYDSEEARTAELTFICENGRKSVNIVQKKVKHLTLAQFAELEDDQYKSTFYRISGTISGWYTTSSITEKKSKEQGYFNIIDEAGTEILIYGCKASIASTEEDFGTAGLDVGDFVTLEGTKYSYQSKARARDSYLISYKKAEAVTTIAGALSATNGAKLELSGTVMAVASSGFVLSDGKDAIYVYKSGHGMAAGDKVSVTGAKGCFDALPEVTNATVTKDGTESVAHATVKDLSAADALSSYCTAWSKIEYVKIAGKAQWDQSNSKLYISVEGAQQRSVPYSAVENYSLYDGMDITVYGYSAAVNESSNSLQIVVDKIEAPAYTHVSNNELTVSATATSVKFMVSANVPWTVTTEDAWIKTYTQSGEGDGEIAVTFDGNTSGEERTARFTIKAEGVDDIVLTLVQKEAGTAGSYRIVTSLDDIVAGEYVLGFYHNTLEKYYAVKNVTISSNPLGVEIDPVEGVLGEVSTEIVWTLSGNNTDGFTVSAGNVYLNSKDAAQGISVASDSAQKWCVTRDDAKGFLMQRKDMTISRYLAAYSSNPVTFRYYNHTSTSYYKGEFCLFRFTAQ